MGLRDDKLLLVEREVERAIMAFYHALDSSDFAYLEAILTPDGVWHRQGKALKGAAMIRQAMKERDPGARTRHLVTNLLIDKATESEAEARYYMTAFRADGDPARPKPDKIELPRGIGSYKVKLARVGERWLFSLIDGETAFKS
jgi:hypothetical protein